MNGWVFFFPTKYLLGGMCLVNTLQSSIADKTEAHAKRLRLCCLEHVRWMERA